MGMENSESKFTPEYEFMDDPEIKSLQLALDQYITAINEHPRNEAKKLFTDKLKLAIKNCSDSSERIRLLIKFLQVNIRINYAGGIGKDINNPVIKSISEANEFLANKYPEIFKTLL
jgi:hypothetical protein